MHVWQLEQPLDAVIFDCDGTLSHVEGIDELANLNGVGPEVSALTLQAMSETGVTPDLYAQRLNLVKPSRQQVLSIGELYYQHIAPDAQLVLNCFTQFHKPIFVASAGLNPAVKNFAKKLNIPENHVFAVDVEFDAQGKFKGYDRKALTTQPNGKCEIVKRIKNKYPHVMLVGDGMNDYAAHDLVTRFVGYGGAFQRKKMEDNCEFYIKAGSMLPLLVLGLTPQEAQELPENLACYHEKALQMLEMGA